MATPTLTQSTRFTDQANTKVYFLPSVAATNLHPTRAEMDAGTNLWNEINDMSGWTVTGNQIDTPDLSSEFTGKIPGSTSSEDSSITFYTSQDGDDVRQLLPRGTTGYIMILDGGDVAGYMAEVYPVTVTANGVQRTATGQEASKVVVSFAITRKPAQNVPVPA